MATRYLRWALLHTCLVLLAACAGPTPEKMLGDAKTAIAAGDFRTAEIHLKNFLRQQPDDVAGRALLGDVSVRTGDFVGAEQSLRRALDLGTDPAPVQLPLVRALVSQGKYKEALAQIDAGPAATNDDDRTVTFDLQAAAYRGVGDRVRAEAAYRAALELAPTSAPIRSELAATLLDLRRVDEGRALIDAVLKDEPTFAPALLLRGNLEVTANQRAAAEATFQQIVDQERGPGHTQAYGFALAQLADVELALGKVDAAAANADALLKLDGRNPMARYMKAAVEVRQNDLAGAESRLERLIADAPQYWPAHRLLGEINVRQDQLGQAVIYLRTAVTNNPSDSAARLQLAELYVRQGNVDGARQLMEESKVDVNGGLFLAFVGRASQQAGLAEQAETYFDRSEQAPPTDASGLVGLSTMYLQSGEFERAINVLQRASASDPQSAQVSNYLLTLIQVRQGDLKAADATAAKLQQQLATAPWPRNLRGMIALAAGDFARSQDFLNQALQLEPKNVSTLLNFARLSAAQNDRAQLEQYLRRVIDVEPTQPVALLGLAQFAAERRSFTEAHALVARLPASTARARAEGDLLVREGKVDEAADLFARTFATDPSEDLALRTYDAATKAKRPRPEALLLTWSSGHPRAVATNFTLGAVALAKNEHDDAVRRFEAVVAETPNHTAALNNLAWLYGERRDPRAIEFAERAYKTDPNNPAIADTLGWLYVGNGNAAKGLPLIESAATSLSGQREVQYHWAAALAETGDTAKALEKLRPLLASSGDFPGRADAEKRLAALQTSRP